MHTESKSGAGMFLDIGGEVGIVRVKLCQNPGYNLGLWCIKVRVTVWVKL